MIEMSTAHRMDFVNICRANPGKTSAECFHLWREWLDDAHGPLCAEIDGRKYPPGTWKSKRFKGSILYKGETATERRAIMSGGYIGPDIQDDPKTQEYLDAWLIRKGITNEQWRERIENRSKA